MLRVRVGNIKPSETLIKDDIKRLKRIGLGEP